MKSPARPTRIFCTRCKRSGPARSCPELRGGKWFLLNVCTTCGAEYAAPSPEGRPVEDVVAERRGQLSLFA